MLQLSRTTLQVTAVSLTVITCMVAVVAWGQDLGWRLSGISLYDLFPLVGLVAFSILWSQYVTLALLRCAKTNPKELSGYFTSAGWVFLAAIFLHPGLLIWQLWRDGFGLPPESYLQHYVAPGLAWAALLGTVSFLLFLSYELRRWYGTRPWWKVVVYLNDIAAIAIFIHGLKLGGTLQSGWFHWVWLFYGATLVCILIWLRVYPALRGFAK